MSRTKRRIRLATVITALALAAVLVAACSLDRWAAIEPGDYVVLPGGAATGKATGSGIQSLVIDRDQSVIVLALAGGSEIVSPFVPRDRSEWPTGCPSNLNSTRMEVLEIAEPLTIGATTFSQPVLVRDCPPDPVRLVLREDGAIGGAGTACPYPEPCIFFAPRPTATP